MRPATGPPEGKREQYREEEHDRLRAEFQDYDRLVELICCVELWLEHEYGPSEEPNSPLIYVNRYPPCPTGQGQRGPDFTALFSCGYGLVGEVKSQVTGRDRGLREQLRQIDRYWTTPFAFRASDEAEPSAVPERKDVLLLVPMENLTIALQSMAEARRTGGPDGLAASPVVVGHYPDTGRGPPTHCWWQFRWDDTFGNARFCETSITAPHRTHLNKHFCSGSHLPMRVDRRKHAEHKVAVGVCNDDPPAVYALVNRVWPYICTDFVASLPQAQKQAWVRQRALRAELAAEAVEQTLAAQMPYGAVRRRWITHALDLLVELRWAKKVGSARYALDFRRPRSMGDDLSEYFIDRLATARATDRVQREARKARRSEQLDLPL